MKKILAMFALCTVYHVHAVREIYEQSSIGSIRGSKRSITLEAKLRREEQREAQLKAELKRVKSKLEQTKQQHLALKQKQDEQKKQTAALQQQLQQQQRDAHNKELEAVRAFVAEYNNPIALAKHMRRLGKKGYSAYPKDNSMLTGIQ